MTHDPITDDPMHGLHPSHEARSVFGYLHRRGGSMRLRPLLRHLRMDPRTFVDAVSDLRERYWVAVVWRKLPPGTPEPESRPLTDIDRLCSTRFGRRKYRSTWPVG